MKKFLVVLMMCLCGFLFAEETSLINVDSFSNATVEEYSFDDWEVQTQSSLKTESFIKMTDKGLGVLVELPEHRDGFVSYKIVPPYSASLNEANKGLGFVENVGEIKSIQMTVEGINKADEVTIYLSRSLNDKVGKPYKFKKNIKFIGDGELIWENPAYISDPKKRDATPGPAYGNEVSNLYIRSIEIRTECNWPISLAYIKNVKVIYDLDKTPEELEKIKESEEIWGINNSLNEEIKERELNLLKEKKRKNEYNESLMHKGDAK